jgi:thiol-disulfide isomerase/thioredoxin
MKRAFVILLIVIIAPLILSACKKQVTGGSGVSPSLTDAETKTVPGYTGNVIAGSGSPYIEFNKADYDKAVAEGKVVFLDFYATWCPICRAEAPEIKAGFDGLSGDAVVGFRVNYNDPETDEEEKELAKQFAVTYQHTKVILVDGQQVLKDGETWTSERFAEEINKVI